MCVKGAPSALSWFVVYSPVPRIRRSVEHSCHSLKYRTAAAAPPPQPLADN